MGPPLSKRPHGVVGDQSALAELSPLGPAVGLQACAVATLLAPVRRAVGSDRDAVDRVLARPARVGHVAGVADDQRGVRDVHLRAVVIRRILGGEHHHSNSGDYRQSKNTSNHG